MPGCQNASQGAPWLRLKQAGRVVQYSKHPSATVQRQSPLKSCIPGEIALCWPNVQPKTITFYKQREIVALCLGHRLRAPEFLCKQFITFAVGLNSLKTSSVGLAPFQRVQARLGTTFESCSLSSSLLISEVNIREVNKIM